MGVNARSLIPLNRNQNHIRVLICVPQAGGGAAAFNSWGRALEEVASVWGTRLPGHESRLLEKPLTTVDEMADMLYAEAREMSAQEIFLFGHCSGALVAYELAHRLVRDSNRMGKLGMHLLVSAQASPMAHSSGSLPADISMQEIVGYLREIGGTPEEVLENDEMIELIAPVIRADLQATDCYDPPANRPQLNIPVTALGGKDDPSIPETMLEQWSYLSTGEFKKHLFDSGHFYLREQEDVVLRYIRELLAPELL